MRREPLRLERKSRALQFLQHVGKVARNEMRQHEAIMQLRVPVDRLPRIGLLPEPRHQRSHQELLRQAHPRMRRHIESAHLQQPQSACGAVRGVELVDAELGAMGVAGHIDQQVAKDPIDQPRCAGARTRIGHFAKRNFEFVEAVLARLVDTRGLAGRPDEHPREHVR